MARLSMTALDACGRLAREVWRAERRPEGLGVGGLSSEQVVRDRLSALAAKLASQPGLQSDVQLWIASIDFAKDEPLTILEKSEALLSVYFGEQYESTDQIMSVEAEPAATAVRFVLLQRVAGRLGRWAVRAHEIPDARTARALFGNKEAAPWSKYRPLLEAGQVLFNGGRFREAAQCYLDADRLVRTPMGLLEAAACLCRATDYVGALWCVRAALLEPQSTFESQDTWQKAHLIEKRLRGLAESPSVQEDAPRGDVRPEPNDATCVNVLAEPSRPPPLTADLLDDDDDDDLHIEILEAVSRLEQAAELPLVVQEPPAAPGSEPNTERVAHPPPTQLAPLNIQPHAEGSAPTPLEHSSSRPNVSAAGQSSPQRFDAIGPASSQRPSQPRFPASVVVVAPPAPSRLAPPSLPEPRAASQLVRAVVTDQRAALPPPPVTAAHLRPSRARSRALGTQDGWSPWLPRAQAHLPFDVNRKTRQITADSLFDESDLVVAAVAPEPTLREQHLRDMVAAEAPPPSTHPSHADALRSPAALGEDSPEDVATDSAARTSAQSQAVDQRGLSRYTALWTDAELPVNLERIREAVSLDLTDPAAAALVSDTYDAGFPSAPEYFETSPSGTPMLATLLDDTLDRAADDDPDAQALVSDLVAVETSSETSTELIEGHPLESAVRPTVQRKKLYEKTEQIRTLRRKRRRGSGISAAPPPDAL